MKKSPSALIALFALVLSLGGCVWYGPGGGWHGGGGWHNGGGGGWHDGGGGGYHNGGGGYGH